MNDGKLVLKGELELLSPLHIGSGENDSTDLDVIKDSRGFPFITFTSFIGALKHHLNENYVADKKDIDSIFGYSKPTNEENDTKCSVILGCDLFLVDECLYSIRTRDGIRLNLLNGIIDGNGKYDFQIVDRNAKFSFMLEAGYSNGSKETLLKYFQTIINMLKCDNKDCEPAGLRIGAKTNNGLGKIQLIKEKLYDYDFSDNKNVIAWLKREEPKSNFTVNVAPLEPLAKDFIIDAYLDLKTSLIQRSYNDNPTMPDASHNQSAGKDILNGQGAKGAISARAKKILNTIWMKDDVAKLNFIDQLFGYVHDPNDKKDNRLDKKPKKGKLLIEERELPAYIAELQTRIKIDRFTGGAINGALFDSMPLFNTMELAGETNLSKKCTRITIRVRNCSEAEAGLMLLVLKDLWTGDLAIGGEKGIGRGVFNGIAAFIKYNDHVIELNQGLENLGLLQKFVDKLIKEAGGVK